MARLGRQNCPGHVDWVFGRPESDFFDSGLNNHYSLFFTGTNANIDAFLEGRPFDYFMAKGITDNAEGFVEGINCDRVTKHTDALDNVVRLLPKQRIPKQQRVDITIDGITRPQVLASNEDDNSVVTIYSESGRSSLLVNTKTGEIIPEIYPFAGNGWKKPYSVFTKDGTLFIDERGQREGALYRVDFSEAGYTARTVNE